MLAWWRKNGLYGRVQGRKGCNPKMMQKKMMLMIVCDSACEPHATHQAWDCSYMAGAAPHNCLHHLPHVHHHHLLPIDHHHPSLYLHPNMGLINVFNNYLLPSVTGLIDHLHHQKLSLSFQNTRFCAQLFLNQFSVLPFIFCKLTFFSGDSSNPQQAIPQHPAISPIWPAWHQSDTWPIKKSLTPVWQLCSEFSSTTTRWLSPIRPELQNAIEIVDRRNVTSLWLFQLL